MVLRRLGQNGQRQCVNGHHCPQILEIEGGDLAVVGLDITEEVSRAMPPGPGVGPQERVVRIPRRVVVEAWADMPAAG
jgi:hypothetical protein